MSAAVELGPVSAEVARRIGERLDRARVVAWYDGERAFGELVAQLMPALEERRIAVVSAERSRLQARRDADAAMVRIGQPEGPVGLLLYLPFARGLSDSERQTDLFEAFARCGVAFGDDEGERLRAIAEQALPNLAAAIERIFIEGTPSLATLDRLDQNRAAAFPLLRQALGTEEPVLALAQALARPDLGKALGAVPGAIGDLSRLASETLGLNAIPKESAAAFQRRLAPFVLLGELAASVGDAWPGALAAVPHAEGPAAGVAGAIAARLRDSETSQEAYRAAAERIEQEYRLPQAFADLATDGPIGDVETFPFQERARLAAVVRFALAGRLAEARSALDGGSGSLWRRDEERLPIWNAAERAVAFLETADRLTRAGRPAEGAGVAGLIERYVAPDGWHLLDQAQRMLEQAAAACAYADEVQDLVRHCRERYLAAVTPVQAAFLAAVRRQGWPPEGTRRLTQTFDQRVAPELQAGRRIAYLLIDSLRYEMGADLHAALGRLGAVTLDAAAAALPAATPVGMAALLPGADGALHLVRSGNELIPAIGETPLPGWEARWGYLKARFGDRIEQRELDEILEAKPDRLAKQLTKADLLIVRSLDIDDQGEGRSPFRARKVMTSILGEVKTAVGRLAAAGFETFVIAADHGHLLMPEPEPGDVITPPDGEWLLRKRRSLLGRSQGAIAGAIVFQAAEVGIIADEPGLELVVPEGFRTFRGGVGYFHEGISPQECLVPVLTLQAAEVTRAADAGTTVAISYRQKRFTSTIIGLKLTLVSMFAQQATIRLEAYDVADPKGKPVGEAADCDALDPVTGEVTLTAGIETSVSLQIDPDFTGDAIEVRATDPATGVILGRLTLKNGRLD